jgi:Ni,Fe-hydrogenase III small subunit
MSQWVINGIRTGIKTTAYPRHAEVAPGVTPGRPCGCDLSSRHAQAQSLVEICPTNAISQIDGKVSVDYRRCIHCYRCARAAAHPLDWEAGYEWAAGDPGGFISACERSLHVIVVDAGDCGACLNEVKQLNNPYYNMHRLGFFITPTPRHADVLLVVGPVTDQMRDALRKIYDAMPTPKRVLAVGACALSGGIFAESFVCAKGVAEVLPVDVEVPGNPPPPLAILHGLLVTVGRKSPVSLTSPAAAMPTKAETLR